MSNSTILKGKWHQLKGKVRERWGELTDDDVDKVAGRAEVLAGVIQERYGIARKRAEEEIDAWFAECDCDDK